MLVMQAILAQVLSNIYRFFKRTGTTRLKLVYHLPFACIGPDASVSSTTWSASVPVRLLPSIILGSQSGPSAPLDPIGLDNDDLELREII